MPETTTARPAEAYFPARTSDAATPPRLGDPATPSIVSSSRDVEASKLLVEGHQLFLASRAEEAAPLLCRALEIYERQEQIPPECVQVLTDLASIATTRGDLVTAESLLQRALAVAHAHYGPEHPDVVAILGGLARINMRRGQFTVAEPLLRRLLEIKRARGEDHPEVATVLASLATVHSALGAHESAEGILRRVLAIREKTLAPNHFATMATLEHLAEACSARGKFAEALTLLYRALAMRDRTLGGAHPSMAAARTRIADLELLVSNEDLGSEPMRPMIATAAPQIAITPHEPVQVKAPPAPRDYVDVEEASQATVGDRLYDEKYDEWEDTFEEPQPYDTLWDRLTGRVAPVRGFVATPRGRVALLAIGLTSLLAALVLATRIRADVVATTAPQPVALPPSPSSPTPRSVDDVDLAADATARTLPMAETSAQRSTPTTATRRRVERAASAVEISEQEPIPLPNVPRFRSVEVPLTPNSGTRASEAITSVDFSSLRDPRPGPAGSLNATSTTARDYVRAVLPPGNPAPVYPPELLRGRVEGRVEAEFLVDANGRVDTRTLRIVSSTDDRFSEAVRAVLPSLRFLPAERAGAKTEEWVSMPFRFALTPQ